VRRCIVIVLLLGVLAARAAAATEEPALERLAGIAPVYCAQDSADWQATAAANGDDPRAWGFTAWTSGPDGVYLDPATCTGIRMAIADPTGLTFEGTSDWRWYVARGIEVLAHESGHVVFATWDETLAECWGVAHWRALMLALGIPPDVRGRAVHVAARAPLAPVPARLAAGVRDERTLWQLLLAFHRSGDPAQRTRTC
jgi:hypothetical protein